MAELKERIDATSSFKRMAFVAIIVALLALALAAWSWARSHAAVGVNDRSGPVDTSLSAILARGTLQVGYGGFPPYTFDDPKETDPAARIKGFSIDLIKEIAARTTPPLKVEFHSFSWDSLRPEVMSGKFDLIVDPVFQTIPRAADFRLIHPYSYFGIAVAIVRKDDNRFKKFADLDRADITIALAEGWTSSEFARQHLKKPKFTSIPVTGDAFNQLDEVPLGRADVALNDVPTVTQYARAHSDTVKALWIETPPSLVPGGFLVRKEGRALADFLDTSVDILIADGTLARIDQRWEAFGAIPILSVQPGAGLQGSTTSR
jgi:ABC-type amino acid transport substrate-binding protein